MSSQPETAAANDDAPDRGSVEMPRPTVAPMALALGLILLAAGALFGLAFLLAGAVVFLTGLSIWVSELLPGRGHFHESLAPLSARRTEIIAELDAVEQLRPGMPGYRTRLPESVHPLSAGIKGGLIGGLVMPLPALLYGILSGHGIWYPVNLLAGMVLPSAGAMTLTQLEQAAPLVVTPDGHRHPRHDRRCVWTALRRALADVAGDSQIENSEIAGVGGHPAPLALDRHQLRTDGGCQSCTPGASGLALVHPFPVCVRSRRGVCRRSFGKDSRAARGERSRSRKRIRERVDPMTA